MWAAQHPHTYLGARYRRIANPRGPQRANVAIQHSILIAIWHMGTTGELYEELGGDYYTRLNPETSSHPRDPTTGGHGLPRHPGPSVLKRSHAKANPLEVNLRVRGRFRAERGRRPIVLLHGRVIVPAVLPMATPPVTLTVPVPFPVAPANMPVPPMTVSVMSRKFGLPGSPALL